MNTPSDVPPQTYALISLVQAHLKHLDKVEGEVLASPQWEAAVESTRTVAAVKAPGTAITAADIPMIVGTGSPDRQRRLYATMPVSAEIAALADESEVALFAYNRRGRLQPANRTAGRAQSRAWYPPAKAIAPMRIIDDAVWAEVLAGGGDPGRPSVFEAAAGWLVLLIATALLATAAYLILEYFHLV
ncbi:hypothetical protein K3N28_09435 [Glycomyces sp. TRM65418]|uniref:hypothetical protein n=1 Tax=Glycomyces sp. TRM65418 TaxID=2867006 RepID=UPI001CE4C7BE|nr:hypothetical protein [Glycomyces sp. TRM65418]MCC3763292.1 hypothetical protein [Glycomyces sp. TRM65418]QZD57291.1 hypothetical protein K3N28_09375 [Glycomyces sp. TRM65418]